MFPSKRLIALLLLGGAILACSLPFQAPATPAAPPADIGVTMTAFALLQTQTALQQTLQAAQNTPAQTPAPGGPPLDCGSDLACLIQAAQACQPATGQYVLDMELFGAQVHTVTQFDIHGPNETGQCAFDVSTVEASVQFTDEARQQMKANGMSDEEIEAQRQSIEQQQLQAGPSGSCVGSGADLAAMLQRWQEGHFEMSDWAPFTCTGGTLAQAGGTIEVTVEVTAEESTSTPEPTPSPSPTAPPAGVKAVAIGNLYCRTGPAPYYPAIDTLVSGDQVTVLARSPEQYPDYWQIRTPRDNVCWVWGRWLNIQGNTDNLTIGEAPPPPPGAFSIRLLRQDTCFGFRFLVFSVINKGPKPIESMNVSVVDLQTGHIFDIPAPQRDQLYHCGAYVDPLDPGQEVELWVPLQNVDLSGRTVQVSGKACTEDGLHGECVERTPFTVKVP